MNDLNGKCYELLIQKDYWGRDDNTFTINVLKFKRWQRKGHGNHAIPIYDHIDTIYFEHEVERDMEWKRMLNDGYISLKAYQPPALKD